MSTKMPNEKEKIIIIKVTIISKVQLFEAQFKNYLTTCSGYLITYLSQSLLKWKGQIIKYMHFVHDTAMEEDCFNLIFVMKKGDEENIRYILS